MNRQLLKGFIIGLCTWGANAFATEVHTDYLVKFRENVSGRAQLLRSFTAPDSVVTNLRANGWTRVKTSPQGLAQFRMNALMNSGLVEYIQPNYKISLPTNPSLKAAQAALEAQRNQITAAPTEDCPIPIPGLCEILGITPGGGTTDNPEFPTTPTGGSGDDPKFSSQWGMQDIGTVAAWNTSRGTDQFVVAVIDTGVDYTHPDLIDNLWRNPREIPNNNIDDDGNGYIDDVVGWDFAGKDNKPFDLKGNLFSGGNPGHGTHCAGNVAARGQNGLGISGVAPNAKIMVLRFIGEAGQGTTADAVDSIRYAVDNGAQITSNSWGSSGEDPNDPVGNQALREAIQYSLNKGTLFIAAAGNGGQDGRGDNNDTARDASFPASYDHENIISVAAVDAQDALAAFSNFGPRTVDIGAPGVKVYSTIVGGGYSDTVMALLGATWDGTSMATPHVAGAAALYWSTHPNKSWREVKAAILNSAKPIPSMQGKAVTNGKLNVEKLMSM